MKLYTRQGDRGDTSLLGGRETRKDDVRIEACGTIDELNAALGLAAARAEGELRERLGRVQTDLFAMGAALVSPDTHEARPRAAPALGEPDVERLERWIDQADEATPPLRNFILPGGTELAARLHVARTVCRRAERRIVAAAALQPVAAETLQYANRLSDLLFAWARLANHEANVMDVVWRTRPDR